MYSKAHLPKQFLSNISIIYSSRTTRWKPARQFNHGYYQHFACDK
ncbi:hypothetical protein ACU8KH_05191 [Lachancea thermotolerans]